MTITTAFLGILLLSFSHLNDGFVPSKSSGVSHVSLKGIAEDFVSEKKNGQDFEKIRIESTSEMNTSEQHGMDKSHPYLADAHHDDRKGQDGHDDDRHDHDRWDHHDNDRHDHDDDNGWFDDEGNHHDHDHDHDHYRH